MSNSDNITDQHLSNTNKKNITENTIPNIVIFLFLYLFITLSTHILLYSEHINHIFNNTIVLFLLKFRAEFL